MQPKMLSTCAYIAAIVVAAALAFFSAFNEHLSPITKITETLLCAGVVLLCEMNLRALHDCCEWNFKLINRFLLSILGVAGILLGVSSS